MAFKRNGQNPHQGGIAGRCRLIAVLSVFFFASPLLKAEARLESNVVYGMYAGLALLLDVHHPANPNGYGIVVIPGSGWHQPLSMDANPLKDAQGLGTFLGADVLLARGYTLFVINHRSAPIFRYPAAIEDAQRAVRYVRHHASLYGIDAAKIGALGHSSGGYLASMLGVLDGEAVSKDKTPVNQESAKVQAVVALAPPTDFISFVTTDRSDKAAVSSFLGSYIAGFRSRDAQEQEFALYEQASPTWHVSPDDPPFLLVHGDRDFTVPFNQTEALQARLQASGVAVRVIRIQEGGHILQTPPSGAPRTGQYYPAMVEWFDHHLRNELR